MFSEQQYDIIKKRILDKFPMMLSKIEGSYSSDLISPLVYELTKAYISMGDILGLGFIETNFNDYLDRRVSEFGVYRKLGSKSHGQIKVTGTEGFSIENGTVVIFNNLRYVVLNDISLPTTDILEVEALEVGRKYNILKDSEFALADASSSVSSLIAMNDFKGGIDVETDEELRQRFVKVVNNPSTSGNKNHYEEWALEVNGVSKAKVYPLWNGNGTVKVMVVGDDNKPVSEDIVKNVNDYIESNKPIGCTLTVTTPSILDVSLVATIKLVSGYTIDDINNSFKYDLDVYLSSINNELTYAKVFGILANTEGVSDISTLTLNGATSNIQIPEDKIININSLEISEVV